MNTIILILLIFKICFLSVSSEDNDGDVVTWEKFMKYAKEANSEFVDGFEPFVWDKFPYGNVSEKCTKSLIRYAKDFKEWKPWAIKMADATAKFPSGFIEGTMTDFGTFQECLQVYVNSNNDTDSFRGQFCMLSMRSELMNPLYYKTPKGKTYVEEFGHPPDWVSDTIDDQAGFLTDFGLYMGICTPSACSPEDLYAIASSITSSADLKILLSDCQTSEPRKWPISVVISVFIISCILGACLLGTLLDIFDHQNTGANRKILKAFSLYTNIPEKLFHIPKKTTELDFIHGIRVLLCVWVILAHVLIYPSRWKQNIMTHLHRMFKVFTPIFVFAESTLLSMGNFFHITGFLLGYALWKKLEQTGGKINCLQILMVKVLRYTPVVLVFYLVSFAVPVLYNGPVWDSTWEYENGKCRKYGWKNLLYVQNFDTTLPTLCWLHTWTLSAIYQIQIFSLFLMVYTYKYPKTGITIGVCTFFGCIARDYIVWTQSGLTAATGLKIKSFTDTLAMVSGMYIQPFHHFPSHAIGMVLGWFVAKHKTLPLTKTHHVIGWTLYTIFSAFLMYCIRIPNTVAAAAIYCSCATMLWSICFSWLVYNCVTGSGGFVNKFLSLKFFIPLSHLSFSVYIIQPLLVVIMDASARDRIYLGKYKLFENAMSLTLFSYIGAFLYHSIVELPFNNLCLLWFTGSTSLPTKEDSEDDVKIEEKKDQ